MKRLVSSYRMRRRLLFIGVPIVAAAAVVGLSLKLGNTAEEPRENFAPRQNEPAQVFLEPKTVRATKSERHAAYETAIRFINMAVKRQDVAASWNLVTRNMRSGYTRRAWESGDIPITTFPAKAPRLAPWRLDYQQKDALGFVFLLLPEEKRRDYQPMTFFVDLKRVGKGKNRRWLVDYFLPAGVSGPSPSPQQGEESQFPNLGEVAARQRGDSRLGGEWMAIPLGILALIIAVPLGFMLRGWYAGRRAERAYQRGL